MKQYRYLEYIHTRQLDLIYYFHTIIIYYFPQSLITVAQ